MQPLKHGRHPNKFRYLAALSFIGGCAWLGAHIAVLTNQSFLTHAWRSALTYAFIPLFLYQIKSRALFGSALRAEAPKRASRLLFVLGSYCTACFVLFAGRWLWISYTYSNLAWGMQLARAVVSAFWTFFYVSSAISLWYTGNVRERTGAPRPRG